MIVVDGSVMPMPGKQAELAAAAKKMAAYLDQRWPLAQPRMVTADMTDGRIHIISLRSSLSEHEAALAEQQADTRLQAQYQQDAPLMVPGSSRNTYSRVL